MFAPVKYSSFYVINILTSGGYIKATAVEGSAEAHPKKAHVTVMWPSTTVLPLAVRRLRCVPEG